MAPIRLTTLLALLPAFSLVAGQTPPGFNPPVSKNLAVNYNGADVSPPGQLLPQPGLATAPSITATDPGAAKGVLILIDLDVPRNGTRVPLLHWLSTDVDISSTPAKLTSSQGAPYLQPSPPAGDEAHRYVFLLFSQPANFQIPKSFQSINPPASSAARVGFDLTAFAAQAGLTAPLAANYITVKSPNAPTASTSFPPIGATSAANLNGTVLTSSLGSNGSPTPTAASPRTTGAAGRTAVELGLGVLAGLAAVVV